MSFDSLGLSAELLRGVNAKGYSRPTPIQAAAIPVVLNGADVLGGAQTGTGKTAAFALPLLERLHRAPVSRRKRRPVRVLVLTPTRELAAQIHESFEHYGKYVSARSTVIFGGVGAQPQIDRLRRGVDVLVATPGRLLDLHGQGALHLDDVETLVLDEADRMLDMGFIHDIRKVLKLLPRERQNLLFSATYSDDIRALSEQILRDPVEVEVERRNSVTALVKHQLYRVSQRGKRHLLAHLVREQQWFQVLVFTRTKHGANRLAEQLGKAGISAAAIHGNKSQGARTRALTAFKSGELQVLVATDIAARGLDISKLPYVVNFDLPNIAEDYVHRIGRTGRAGETGYAISLVGEDDAPHLRQIERLLGRSIESLALPDGFAAPSATPDAARPEQQRKGSPGNGRRSGPRRTQPADGPSSAHQPGRRTGGRRRPERGSAPRQAS
ncbi:MAG: DEAD/DEAH box helicase [Pseudomonadota bacterium]